MAKARQRPQRKGGAGRLLHQGRVVLKGPVKVTAMDQLGRVKGRNVVVPQQRRKAGATATQNVTGKGVAQRGASAGVPATGVAAVGVAPRGITPAGITPRVPGAGFTHVGVVTPRVSTAGVPSPVSAAGMTSAGAAPRVPGARVTGPRAPAAGVRAARGRGAARRGRRPLPGAVWRYKIPRIEGTGLINLLHAPLMPREVAPPRNLEEKKGPT